MMKLVAVTGGTGFIGRHVVALLQQRGVRVRVLSREPASRLGCESVIGDITESKAVAQVVDGADAVIHLAGVAHTTLRTAKERENAWHVNVEGSRLVLQESDKRGVRRVLLASSAHVYREHCGEDIPEAAAIGNEDFYSKTKAAMEELAGDFDRRVELVIARPCLTYGPGVRFNLERLMRALDRGYYFHLRGEEPKRSFLSVHNAAAAMVHLLEAGSDGQAYNIADEHPANLVEFVDRLAALMKCSTPRRIPCGLARAAAHVLTPLEKLGFKAPISHQALAKLTETFTISTKKLAATRFEWPDTGEIGLREMVESYQRSKQQGPGKAA
jgi:nucleoside-diphosphate-sugar epimerase